VITEIQKGKGIEGLVGYALTDEDGQITTVSGIFEELEELYTKKRGLESIWTFMSSLVTQVFTPEQINTFLQTTIQHEDSQIYANWTGRFVTQLIQNSYKHGHNAFILNTTALRELHYLGSDIRCTSKKPIEITIVGNTGTHCGSDSANSIFNITGNTGTHCGYQSTFSTYNIRGNPGKDCGLYSEYSTYNITGNPGNGCGAESENSTFDIIGNPGNGCGGGSKNSTFNITGKTGKVIGDDSKNSTYKTANKKTIDKLLKYVPKPNRVIFIRPDGTEEVKRER